MKFCSSCWKYRAEYEGERNPFIGGGGARGALKWMCAECWDRFFAASTDPNSKMLVVEHGAVQFRKDGQPKTRGTVASHAASLKRAKERRRRKIAASGKLPRWMFT